MELFKRQHCKTCFYFRGDENKGVCFLKPPLAAVIMVQGITGPAPAVMSYRPEVAGLDFCEAHAEDTTKEIEARIMGLEGPRN